MREIKFRAWDVDNKMFVYLLIGHHSVNPVIKPIKANIDEWQQYTGLNDKRGVDIFEGDVVVDKYGSNRSMIAANLFHVNLGIVDIPHREQWVEITSYLEEWEVIGNIYENPELINSQS